MSENWRDEGYIKFNPTWKKQDPPDQDQIKELNSYRNKLFQMGLIGVYPDGIGFGNISERYKSTNQFFISGSQTGKIEICTNDHYCFVKEANIKKNSLICEGPIIASSESLTHYMFYNYDQKINAVIHIHNSELWSKFMNKIPTTKKSVPYGTPEMAYEIGRLFKEDSLKEEKVLVMAGHEDGIISFGNDLEDAFKSLSKLL